MSHTSRFALLAAALVSLSGCLQTHEERIHVRRELKVIEKEKTRVRPDAYEEWLLARQMEQEKLRLTPELNREYNHHELTSLRVENSLSSIPEDPFAAYEKDRIDHLHRWWRDHDHAPPEPDPDVMVAVKKAEDPDAAEEGDQAEGDDAGDEGEGDEYDEDEDWEDDEDWDE